MSIAKTVSRLSGLLCKSSFDLQTLTRVQISQLFNEQRKQFSNSAILNVDKSKLKYTDKHEWISLNENVGTVGITEYAQAS
jgi:hypothetical protein